MPFPTCPPPPGSVRAAAMLALSWALAGCAPSGAPPPPPPAQPPPIGMANPASAHCIERGGRLEMARNADGGEYGMCHLPDGTVIEEWALFRRDRPAEGR